MITAPKHHLGGHKFKVDREVETADNTGRGTTSTGIEELITQGVERHRQGIEELITQGVERHR